MSCSVPKTTSQDVRFNGETAVFMGVWVLPTANSLDVVRGVREVDAGYRGAGSGRHEGRNSLRLDRSTSRTPSTKSSERSLKRSSSSSW